jgi:signal transduction histidine kinase
MTGKRSTITTHTGRSILRGINAHHTRTDLMLWAGALIASCALSIIGWETFDSSLRTIGLLSVFIAAAGLLSQAYFAWKMRRSGVQKAFEGLRNELRRARAVYRMSNTLSSSLNYAKALEEAQQVGQLALFPRYRDLPLISAVLLFRHTDNYLHVATARQLTRQDLKVKVSARSGILAKVLESHKPIFGESGTDDPELRHYAGFQNAKSLLAIPLRQAYEGYGVLLFGAEVPDAFDRTSTDALTAIGIQVSIALKNAVLYQGILDDKERIVSIDEQARKKLSRDLHDGPTQTIGMIATRSSVVQTFLKRGKMEQAHEELDKIQQLAQRTAKEIRHLLFSLRPLVLENRGLTAALHELAKKMKDTYDQQVNLQIDERVEALLDEEAQGTVFYIIEEAINNAHKHAEAKSIWARLLVQDPYIIVEVEDNGHGFNVRDIEVDYYKRGSLGMMNLRERSEMLGGEFSINSEVGKGTSVHVIIPITESRVARGQGATEPLVKAEETTMALSGLNADDEVAYMPPDEEAGWSDIPL